MSKVVPLPPLGHAVQQLEQDFAAATFGGGFGTSKVARTPPINHRPRAAVVGGGSIGQPHHHAKGPAPISKRKAKKEAKQLDDKNLGLEKRWNQALHIPFADGSTPGPRKGRISTTSPRRAATVPPMMHHSDIRTSSPSKGYYYPEGSLNGTALGGGRGNSFGMHGSFLQSPMIGNGVAMMGQQQHPQGFSPMATMSTTTSTPMMPQQTPAVAAQGMAAGGGRSYTEDELRLIVREEKDRERQQFLHSEAQKEKRLQYEFEAELQKERQRVLERQRELDWEREKARMREVERERELTRQQMLDRELEQARERARQAEREREKADRWAREQERERERQLEQERELERQQEREAEREREVRRERERRDFIHHTQRQALEDAEQHERTGIVSQADGITDVLRSMHQQQLLLAQSVPAPAAAAQPAPTLLDFRSLPPYFHHLFLHAPAPVPVHALATLQPQQYAHQPESAAVVASPTHIARESASSGVQTDAEKHSVGTAPITPPLEAIVSTTSSATQATEPTHNNAATTTTSISTTTTTDEAFVHAHVVQPVAVPPTRKVDAASSPRTPHEDPHQPHQSLVVAAPVVVRAESAMQTEDETPAAHHGPNHVPAPATPVATPPLQHRAALVTGGTQTSTAQETSAAPVVEENAASQQQDRASVVVTPASGSRSQVLTDGPPRPGSESGDRVRRAEAVAASRAVDQQRPATHQSLTAKINDEQPKKQQREQQREKPSTGTVCNRLTDLQFCGLGRVFATPALDCIMRVATGEERPLLPRRAGPQASRYAEAAAPQSVETHAAEPSVASALAASERNMGDAYLGGTSMLLRGTMGSTVNRTPLMFRAPNDTVLPPNGAFVMVDRTFYKDIQEPPRPAPPASQLLLDRQAAMRRVQIADPLCRAALPDVDVPDPAFDFERHPHNRDSFVSNLFLNIHKHVPNDVSHAVEDFPIY